MEQDREFRIGRAIWGTAGVAMLAALVASPKHWWKIWIVLAIIGVAVSFAATRKRKKKNEPKPLG